MDMHKSFSDRRLRGIEVRLYPNNPEVALEVLDQGEVIKTFKKPAVEDITSFVAGLFQGMAMADLLSKPKS